MPFETGAVARQKIAIVGAGVSGMGAAHALSAAHDVTLIEAEPRLGGHARTIVAGRRGDQPVDTGFIVFNYVNYPQMTGLFEALDVPVIKSDMSFGATINGGWLEYNLQTYRGMFAQTRNLVRPAYAGMLRDILRFHAGAREAAADPTLTLGGLVEKLRLGRWFQEYFLLPFSGAIWSTPLERMLDYPAQPLVRFFDNHGLLQAKGAHQWYTVKGGSREYVSRLEAATRAHGATIRLGAPVQGLRRVPGGVELRCAGGEWEGFDHVVLATHSDASLALLSDPSPEEAAALGAMRYQANDAYLHCDPSVMPARKACWASWVYQGDHSRPRDRIGVSYWMNSLQPFIPADDLLLVTLNPQDPIREEMIYDQTSFMHPVYDHASWAAQEALRGMQGQRNTWFCGAYMKNGFHEDGYSSGLDVARALGVAPAWA